MKSLCNSIKLAVTLLVASSQLGLGQDSETFGFVNLVNLIPGNKPCKIGLAGQDVVPGGLASAQSTGWFIVPSGSLQLSLEVEGYDKGAGNVDLSAMQSSVFVVFLESSGKPIIEGKPVRPRVKLKRCDAIEGKDDFFLKLVSLCPGENTFLLGQNPFTLKHFQEVEVPGWNGGGFKISRDKVVIGQTQAELEKDPFYLLIGTDHAGNYSTVFVRASKQDLPPWMKDKKKNP